MPWKFGGVAAQDPIGLTLFEPDALPLLPEQVMPKLTGELKEPGIVTGRVPEAPCAPDQPEAPVPPVGVHVTVPVKPVVLQPIFTSALAAAVKEEGDTETVRLVCLRF